MYSISVSKKYIWLQLIISHTNRKRNLPSRKADSFLCFRNQQLPPLHLSQQLLHLPISIRSNSSSRCICLTNSFNSSKLISVFSCMIFTRFLLSIFSISANSLLFIQALLRIPHLSENAFLFQKLFFRTLLCYLSIFHHNDPIRQRRSA